MIHWCDLNLHPSVNSSHASNCLIAELIFEKRKLILMEIKCQHFYTFKIYNNVDNIPKTHK